VDMSVEGRKANLMRGGGTERELQRFWEHFEGEAKVMRAAMSMLRQRLAGSRETLGGPS
jgi:hypothetical protein